MSEPLPIVRGGQLTSPPVFDRIAIVGLGLIGGSLALAVKRQWPSALVIAVDRKDVIERATVAHAIDVGADDLGLVSGADLIVLAAPVDENVRILHELAELIPGSALITDVGGVKRSIANAAAGLPARLVFVGGHPMAGAAVGGFEHARPDLFAGRPWILDSDPDVDVSRLTRFLAALGAVCLRMSSGQHDHVMAFLSALPQLTVGALMHVVGEAVGADGLALAGKGLEDTTRLATSPVEVWKPIANANADEIGTALDALMEVLTRLREDLGRGEVLDNVFRSANKWKAELAAKSRARN
ncbi:MAG: prephenate dehydrogenase [Acidobacteriota bacterium]